MTVGERIQYYRKKLGLSQEELGQKLLVSRQTVSLWEKDQTLPTVDNLIRLKDLFGVNVDDILSGSEETDPSDIKEPDESAPVPKEIHIFEFSEEESKHIARTAVKALIPGIFLLCIIAALFVPIVSFLGAPKVAVGVVAGVALIIIAFLIYVGFTNQKGWKKLALVLPEKRYVYEVFDDFFYVSIFRCGEISKKVKIPFTEVKGIQDIGEHYLFNHLNLTYIVRKEILEHESDFFLFFEKSVKKKVGNKKLPTQMRRTTGIWRTVSFILFIASLASIYGPLYVFDYLLSVSFTQQLQYMWIFFLFLPIPIASIVVGFVLRSKGFLAKKNIIVGFIMATVLAVYGSFSFLAPILYDNNVELIETVEEYTLTEIPDYEDVAIQNWSVAEQTSTNEYLYYSGSVFFDENSSKKLEEDINLSSNWVTTLPSELIGILHPLTITGYYDYYTICNIDTGEINSLPSKGGTYHFVSAAYHCDSNEMFVVEYTMVFNE